MSSGRKILDELKDLVREQVGDIERVGAERLDRLAERGVQELQELRDQVAEKTMRSRPRGDSDRGAFDAAPPVSSPTSRSSSRRDARRAARNQARRHRRHSRRGSSRSDSHTKSNPDPAERERQRLLAKARRRANNRIAFITHFGSYLATLALLMVTTRSIRAVLIVGLAWGIGVFCHYLWAMAAPKLRDSWVEREVGTRSAQGVQSERRLVETRSRRSLEDLSASIAHEIRNPITAAKSLVQQLGEDPGSAENVEYAGLALSELDRVERSISHLLRYARDEEPRLESLELRAVALAAVEGIRERAASSGVDLRIDFDRHGEVRGDFEKLRRVIENLIANAIDALVEAQVVAPRVEVLGGENLAGSEVWLRVIDNGPGIDECDRDRIWSPFFTTREKGTGLGLALSRKTIEAHGGRIELVFRNRPGTEFVLTFARDQNAGPSAEKDDL
jgi:signal transduction histidine kinase